MKAITIGLVRLYACVTVAMFGAMPAVFAQTATPQPGRMATFRGGSAEKFSQWVNNHVRYPRAALKKSIEGEVVYSFVVDQDGRVKDVRIVESPAQELSNEVIRVLEHAPKWKPAVQDGKPVKVRFQSRVIFLPPR